MSSFILDVRIINKSITGLLFSFGNNLKDAKTILLNLRRSPNIRPLLNRIKQALILRDSVLLIISRMRESLNSVDDKKLTKVPMYQSLLHLRNSRSFIMQLNDFGCCLEDTVEDLTCNFSEKTLVGLKEKMNKMLTMLQNFLYLFEKSNKIVLKKVKKLLDGGFE